MKNGRMRMLTLNCGCTAAVFVSSVMEEEPVLVERLS